MKPADDRVCTGCSSWPCQCFEMAQDRIKELEAEVERLRAALEKIREPLNQEPLKSSAEILTERWFIAYEALK